MELKSNPGRRFSPSKGHTQLDPGLTGQGGAFQFQVGNSSSQSSVVSKHFCFAAESSGRGAELVTASTKNGAGGEMSGSPSF